MINSMYLLINRVYNIKDVSKKNKKKLADIRKKQSCFGN